MTIKDRSLGPLYFAGMPLNQRRCPVHKVTVTQVMEPWRQGKAVVFPLGRFKALAVGLWFRNRVTPKLLDVSAATIGEWRADEVEEETTS